MIDTVRNPDVLAEVVDRVLTAGAAEFEVEYDEGEEHVMALSGCVGVSIASFPSDSEEARELRSQLYALKTRRRKIIHAGIEYVLRVKIFDSFGEDVFRVTLVRS
ncbi:MAG: hypothetical protein U0586_00530 [Candidatus Brocadiaceae bacterium]